MNARDAWSTLGRDFEDVLAEIRRSPVEGRAEAAASQLEGARGLAKKLMAAHHPDRNPGDEGAAARFRRVKQAIQVIEAETEALRQKLRERAEAPPRQAVFIEVGKRR